MSEHKSKIIAFEGPPLTGKTTQIGRLAEYLREHDYEVEVLKRATEYCPTREEINELREEADGWTRELDRVTPEYETELWADYYREKTEAVKQIEREQEPDYILLDRYFLSLIPTQELALEESVADLAERYGEEISELNPDLVFLFKADEDIFPSRYREREGKEIPESFHEDMNRMGDNYQKLGELFSFTELDATNSRQEVFKQVKEEMREKELL